MANQASLDRTSYELSLRQAWLILQIVQDLPVLAMLSAINTAETTGPILNPTLYQQNHQKMQEDKELLQALSPLVNLSEKFRQRLPYQ